MNRFFRFRQPAFSQLGPLEERLMQEIWSRGNATARELLRAAAEQAIRQLLESGVATSLPLSYLVETVAEHDVQLLDELHRMIECKRRELRKTEHHDV